MRFIKALIILILFSCKSYSQGFLGYVVNSDNPIHSYYDVRDWGFVSDGVTDNTAAFQALLDTIGVRKQSAVILLDTGIIVIAGALQDITNANSQLLLPQISLDSQTLVITIVGRQVPPNQFFTTSVVPTRGFSTIKSTLTGASGTASVISGHHVITGIGPQNNVTLNLYNLILAAPPDPTFSFINMQYHQPMSVDGVLIHAGNVKIDAAIEPNTSTSYGIIFPEYNHTPCNNVGRLDIWGFYYGWRISERTDVKNVSSWVCKYVGDLAFGYHSNTFQVIGSYWCPNGIKGSGTNTVRIMQYQMENAYAGWVARGYDIVDPSNYITGDLVYELIQSGGRDNDAWTVNGAANLEYDSLGGIRHGRKYASTAVSLTARVQDVIEVTATGQTITLPTAVGRAGRTYTIKLTASGSCTIATTSSQNIDASTTYSLSAQYKYVTVQSTGAHWIIIANN